MTGITCSSRCCSLFCRWLISVALVIAAGCGHGPGSNRDEKAHLAAEARAARAFDVYSHQGPDALYGFIRSFPKGADLHVHLDGAVYAETLIRDAAEDGLCVDETSLGLTKPPCRAKQLPAKELSQSITAENQAVYDRLVDSLSMRSFVPYSGWSGHDQFFSTFGKFRVLSGTRTGEWVDEVASRAASQNEQYLELMHTPAFGHAAQIAHTIGWSPELSRGDRGALARLRQTLLDDGLRGEVEADRDEVRQAELKRRQLEHCGTAQSVAACSVQVRYLYQVLRGFPPEQVFAQALLGFETVEASMKAHEDTWVGINFVMPEDGLISMRDYTLQMQMLDYLHSIYPGVHISLHAGELALGQVPPEGLRFHIRQAVELGHAERIGHGVDVMQEDNPRGLLKELVENHIMVEINLSSNQEILGVEGEQHPFPIYRQVHVPVALSTDDEGVSRIDLTHEYVRAAIDYGLSYSDLKQLARTGMEHDFLPGPSLWAAPDRFNEAVRDCSSQPLGADRPTADCKAFLDRSQKASAQWELERRFRAFDGMW
jgi:adenosine deaminase